MKKLIIALSIASIFTSCATKINTKRIVLFRATEMFYAPVQGEYKPVNNQKVKLIQVDSTFRSGDVVEYDGENYQIKERVK